MPRRDAPTSFPPVRWRRVMFEMCRRKMPYASLEAALERKRVMAQENGDRRLRAYPCPFAGPVPHWHVGLIPSPRTVEQIASAVRARREELGHEC